MKPEELRKKRERLGMTQAKLAARLKVERITIIRWENGQIEIPHVVELAIKEVERQESR